MCADFFIAPTERCDPTAESLYPPARIPLTPPITSSSLGRDTITPPSLLDISHISVSAGRAAITLALQHAAIGAREEVLVPAYHCESMIAPVEFVGSTPVYYKVQANTSVDLADLECKITPRTRAVLATHYFGFPQDISKLRELCDKHKLVLIEDCAHAFFGSKDGFTLGTCGDYAIGSAMKFFPLFDGGILASSRHALRTIELVSPPLGLEMKAATNVVEYAMRYRRLPLLSLPLKVAVALKDFLAHHEKDFPPRARQESGATIVRRWLYTRSSLDQYPYVVGFEIHPFLLQTRTDLHFTKSQLPPHCRCP